MAQFVNRARARQLICFDGMQYGTIMPTDIDGAIEYHDKAAVFFELKYRDTPVPVGQKLALERFVKDIIASGRDAIAIVAEHSVTDPNDDVIVKDCNVREIYHGRDWRPPHHKYTVGELVDAYLFFMEAK